MQKSFPKQSVTVAIADADCSRRAGYEHLLQGEFGISLLTDDAPSNESSNSRAFLNRRTKPRTNITACENEVARIKRLKPLVLVVNMNLYDDDDCSLLLSLRRECPESLMILLTDSTVHENTIMQCLEIGARGFLKYEAVQLQLSVAIQMVGCGEAWVPRKMLGSVVSRMSH